MTSLAVSADATTAVAAIPTPACIQPRRVPVAVAANLGSAALPGGVRVEGLAAAAAPRRGTARQLLDAALAGVRLGSRDRQFLARLVHWDKRNAAAVASLLERAREAGRSDAEQAAADRTVAEQGRRRAHLPAAGAHRRRAGRRRRLPGQRRRVHELLGLRDGARRPVRGSHPRLRPGQRVRRPGQCPVRAPPGRGPRLPPRPHDLPPPRARRELTRRTPSGRTARRAARPGWVACCS